MLAIVNLLLTYLATRGRVCDHKSLCTCEAENKPISLYWKIAFVVHFGAVVAFLACGQLFGSLGRDHANAGSRNPRLCTLLASTANSSRFT